MFVICLLTSECNPGCPSEQNLLSRIICTIQGDSILRQWIHIIPVDNPYTRSILSQNVSGVCVSHTPAFAIRHDRYNNSCKPKIYDIFQVNFIFQKVYRAHYRLLEQQKKSVIEMTAPTLDLV